MYNKLFTSILDSSIWLEDDGVVRVWVTLLASMDESGFCKFGGIASLARRANKTLNETQRVVEVLESPDKFDPEQDFEGRRIERVPGGWMVLNAVKYRDMATRSIAMERNRIRVQKFRAAKKGEPEPQLDLLPPAKPEPKPRPARRRSGPNATLGVGEVTTTPFNLEDALVYWRRVREKGLEAFKDCPAEIRKMLEDGNA